MKPTNYWLTNQNKSCLLLWKYKKQQPVRQYILSLVIGSFLILCKAGAVSPAVYICTALEVQRGRARAITHTYLPCLPYTRAKHERGPEFLAESIYRYYTLSGWKLREWPFGGGRCVCNALKARTTRPIMFALNIQEATQNVFGRCRMICVWPRKE